MASISLQAASWMPIARKEIGVREYKGLDKNNARILEYFKAVHLHATNDETPWCAAFVNWVLLQAGIIATQSARARSFTSWGRELSEPVPGAIIVLSRGVSSTQGHVGFFSGFDLADRSFYEILGGNQGDAVSIAGFHKSRVIAIRYPKAITS